MRSSRRRALRFLLVFITITAWFLSGWPQIWRNPAIPPEVKEARAATLDSEDWEAFSDGDTTLSGSFWSNLAGGDCDMQVDSDGTPSSNTGPSVDHTYGDTTHKYLYLETSSGWCQGDGLYAQIETDNIDADTYSVDIAFWWHMYGSTIGSLHLDVYDGTWNNSVWSRSGEGTPTADAWYNQQVDLDAYTGTIKLRFRAISAGNYYGDLALDDIEITGELRVEVPDAPALYSDDGGVTQIAFNNIRQNSTTPTFRASATHTDDFNRFQLELNTAQDFGGTAYTQTFSGTYGSGVQYNLAADSLSPSLPTADGATYYARIRASADGGSNYGAWSTDNACCGTWSYTYKGASEDPDWFQTTDEQFGTGTLSSTQTSGSDSVELGGGGATIIYLTSGTTWDVPNDWNSSNNSIEVIGAGGNGGLATDSTNSGGGGGGGEYRKVTNVSLTASSTVNINIPSGGDGSSADGAWIKNNSGTIVVEAKNGGNASGVTAGSGGTGGSCLGGCAANNDGGAGGIGGSAAEAAGGGGGGSAGPSGAGKDGGDGYGGTDRGGGGGGGSNGGSSTAGETPTGGDGGQGGHGTSGTGGGAGGIGVTSGDAPGEDGTNGGGGGGGGYTRSDGDDPGGSGSCDTTWDSTHGACGGGGGAGSASGTGGTGDKDGGPGGTYGGGGGGCGMSGTLDSGECDGTGVGGQGIIVITYAPDASSGTIMSTEIDFDWVADATSWSQVDWTEDETNGIVTLQVYYTASTACDTIIPNTDLSGNSTGFASGPIDISGLNTTTYNRICLKATLTDDNGTPYLNDWTVKWSSGAVVSVSVSDGVVTYDIMPENTSKSTLSGELNDMQTATNDGNVTENFNIKGQDATGGGCTWTLASSNGSNQYVHQFCNDTDLDCSSPPTNYTALTTSYQTLDTGITASGEVDFQLRLTTPNPSSCYGQQSVDVTIQAVQ